MFFLNLFHSHQPENKLIEPNIKNRFPQAEAALLVLQTKQSIKNYRDKSIVKPKYSLIKITKNKEQLIIDIPPLYQRKQFGLGYYLGLFWSIISLLNRLAIFVSNIWFGAIFIIFGFYNIIFTCKNLIVVSIQSSFLIATIWVTSLGHYMSIPIFSICLIAIDLLLAAVFKYNFVGQLLFANKLIFHKQQSDRFIYARKFFRFWHKENLNYILPKISLLQAFPTSQEKTWLQAEIDEYLRQDS